MVIKCPYMYVHVCVYVSVYVCADIKPFMKLGKGKKKLAGCHPWKGGPDLACLMFVVFFNINPNQFFSVSGQKPWRETVLPFPKH